MAYKKNYKRSYKGGSVAKTANAALQLAKKLSSKMNVEIKKFDTSGTGTSVPTTGFVHHISQVTQGDTISNRDGNSIKAKSILLKASLIMNSSVTDTEVKMYLVRDNQQIGDTAPALGDLIDTTHGILGFLNNNTAGRFTVLWTHNYIQNLDQPVKHVEKYLTLDSHVRYNGNAAADIQKGGYYWIGLSNRATFIPSMNWCTRFTFVDN